MTLVVIVGATGTGKSDLSLSVAEGLWARGMSAEIVNADAMQLYRGMDVGTAKLTIAERRGIPHHMLDVLEPSDEASVADYQRDARWAIEDIEARGSVPILVGGSGLYVSSVIQDFRFPGTDPAVRARLEAELIETGPGTMYRRLLEVDPDPSLDPLAVLVDEGDQGDRRVERHRGEAGEAVEHGVRRRVQERERTQRGEAFGLVGRHLGRPHVPSSRRAGGRDPNPAPAIGNGG